MAIGIILHVFPRRSRFLAYVALEAFETEVILLTSGHESLALAQSAAESFAEQWCGSGWNNVVWQDEEGVCLTANMRFTKVTEPWPAAWPPLSALPIRPWLTWAHGAFPDATAASCLDHLFDEVLELAVAMAMSDEAGTREEAADVAMLALHTALRAGGKDLPAAMAAKLEINRGRTWDGEGRHHKPKPDDTFDALLTEIQRAKAGALIARILSDRASLRLNAAMERAYDAKVPGDAAMDALTSATAMVLGSVGGGA